LDFFDIPRAFGCPLTVRGFEVWKNGLPIDQAPLTSKTYGLGNVPVWFVAWSELEAATADQVLTITELASLPSLQIGYADFYEETLQPPAIGDRTPDHLQINATGALENGTAFRVRLSARILETAPQLVHHVSIDFE